MAVTVGSVVAEVNANIGGFLKGIDRIQKELAKLTSGAQAIKVRIEDREMVGAIKRIDTNINTFMVRLKQAFNTIGRLFDTMDGKIGNSGEQLKAAVGSTGAFVKASVQGNAGSVFNIVDRFVSRLNPLIIGTLLGISNALRNIFDFIRPGGSVLEGGRQGFLQLVKAITFGKASFTSFAAVVLGFFKDPKVSTFGAFIRGAGTGALGLLTSLTGLSLGLTIVQKVINGILGKIGDPETGTLGKIVRLVKAFDKGLLGLNVKLEILRSKIGVVTGVLVTVSTLALALQTTAVGFFIPILAGLNTFRFIWSGIIAKVRLSVTRLRARFGDGQAQFKLFLFSLRQLFPVLEAIATIAQPLAKFIRGGNPKAFMDRLDSAMKTVSSQLPKIVALLKDVSRTIERVLQPLLNTAAEKVKATGNAVSVTGAKVDKVLTKAVERTTKVKDSFVRARQEAEKMGKLGGVLGLAGKGLAAGGKVAGRAARSPLETLSSAAMAAAIGTAVASKIARVAGGSGRVREFFRRVVTLDFSAFTAAASTGSTGAGAAAAAGSSVAKTAAAVSTPLIPILTGALTSVFQFATSGPIPLLVTAIGLKFVKNTGLLLKDMLGGIASSIGERARNFIGTLGKGFASRVFAPFGRFFKTREERVIDRSKATGAGRLKLFGVDLFRTLLGSIPGAQTLGATSPEAVRKERSEARALRREDQRRTQLEQLRVQSATGLTKGLAKQPLKTFATNVDAVSSNLELLQVAIKKMIAAQNALQAAPAGGSLQSRLRDPARDASREVKRLLAANPALFKAAGVGTLGGADPDQGSAAMAQAVAKALSTVLTAKGSLGGLEKLKTEGAELSPQDIANLKKLGALVTSATVGEKAGTERAGERRARRAELAILQRTGSRTGLVELGIAAPGQEAAGSSTRLKEAQLALGTLADIVETKVGGKLLALSTRLSTDVIPSLGFFSDATDQASKAISSVVLGSREMATALQQSETASITAADAMNAFSKSVSAATRQGGVTADMRKVFTTALRAASQKETATSAITEKAVRGVGKETAGEARIANLLSNLAAGNTPAFLAQLSGIKKGPKGEAFKGLGAIEATVVALDRVFIALAKRARQFGKGPLKDAANAVVTLLVPLRQFKQVMSVIPKPGVKASPERQAAVAASRRAQAQGLAEASLLSAVDLKKITGPLRALIAQEGKVTTKAFRDMFAAAGTEGGQELVLKLLGQTKGIPKALGKGLKKDSLEPALETLLSVFKDMLALRSPPKKGPLRAAMLSLPKFGLEVGKQVLRGKGGLKKSVDSLVEFAFGDLRHRSLAGGVLGGIEKSFVKFGAVIGSRILAGKNFLQQSLSDFVQGGFQGLPAVMGRLLNETIQLPFKAVAKVIGTSGKIIGAVVSGAATAVTKLTGVFTGILKAIPFIGGLGSALEGVFSIVGGITAGLGDLVKFITGTFASAINGVGKLIGGVAKVAGNALSGLLKMLLETNQSILKLGRQAQQLGIPVGEFDLLTKALEQTNVSSDELTQSMLTLQRSVNQALTGSREQIAIFSRLGLSIDDLRTKRLDDVFLKIADSLGRARGNAALFERGLDIMGAGFGNLRTVILRGSKDINRALANVSFEGGITSKEDVKNAEAIAKTMVRIGQIFSRIKAIILTAFGPFLKDALEFFEKRSKNIFEAIRLGIPAILASVKKVFAFIKDHGFAVLAINLVEALLPVFSTLFNFVKAKIAELLPSEGSITTKIFSVAGIILRGIISKIRDSMSDLIASLGQSLVKEGKKVKGATGFLQEALGNTLKAIGGGISEKGRGVAGSTSIDQLEATIAALRGDTQKTEAVIAKLQQNIDEESGADFTVGREKLIAKQEAQIKRLRAGLAVQKKIADPSGLLGTLGESAISLATFGAGIDDPFEGTRRKIRALEDSVRDYKAEIKGAPGKAKKWREEQEAMAAATGLVVDSLGNVTKATDDTGKAVVSVTGLVAQFRADLAAGRDPTKDFIDDIGNLFTPAVKALNKPLGETVDLLSKLKGAKDIFAEASLLFVPAKTLSAAVTDLNNKLLDIEIQRASKLGLSGEMHKRELELIKAKISLQEEFNDKLGNAQRINKDRLDTVLLEEKVFGLAKAVVPDLPSGAVQGALGRVLDQVAKRDLDKGQKDFLKNFRAKLISGEVELTGKSFEEIFSELTKVFKSEGLGDVDQQQLLSQLLADPTAAASEPVKKWLKQIKEVFGVELNLADPLGFQKQLQKAIELLDIKDALAKEKGETGEALLKRLLPDAALNVQTPLQKHLKEVQLRALEAKKAVLEIGAVFDKLSAGQKKGVESPAAQALIAIMANKLGVEPTREAVLRAIGEGVTTTFERERAKRVLGAPIGQALGSITRDFTSGALKQAILDAKKEGRKIGDNVHTWMVITAQFGKSIFDSAMGDLIGSAQELITTSITKMATETLGITSELSAGITAGLMVGVGAVLKNLNDSANVVKDTVKSAVESTESIRGIISGETTVKLKEVGEQLKEAQQPIVERLDAMIAIMRSGGGLGGVGGVPDLQPAVAGNTA